MLNVSLRRPVLAITIAGTLAACTDRGSLVDPIPQARPTPGTARLTILDPGAAGIIVVCAAGNSASFTVSATPAVGTLLGGGTFTLAAGACGNAWTAAAGDLTVTTIAVTQTSANFLSIEATAVPPSGLPFLVIDQANETVSWLTNIDHGGGATFNESPPPPPPPPPPPGSQGCTPGYWKQTQHFASWNVYTQSQTIGSVFTVPAGYVVNGTAMGNFTLLQGLSFKGGNDLSGKAQILLRAAIAGLLNTANGNVSYAFTAAQIISQVNAALASQNETTITDLATLIDNANNGLGGCPLN